MGAEAKKVNDVFRKGMLGEFPGIHWVRVENGYTHPGTPDINFAYQGQEHWVECKWVPSKTGARFSHPLTAAQCAWHVKRADLGCNTWVLARRVDTFRLWYGIHAREIVDQGWNADAPCLQLIGDWDWGMMWDAMKEFP